MAGSTHRCHGNFPQRRAAPFPQGVRCRVQLEQEAVSPETGPSLAARAEETLPPAEHITGSGFCDLGKEPNWSYNRETRTISPSSGKLEHLPDESVKALLSRMSIHPEAQRILGNSSIAVVSLERLNFQTVTLSCLQPVVSLMRLPCQIQQDVSLYCPQQIGFSPIEDDSLEIKEDSVKSEAAEGTLTSWTEPFCPEGSLFDEPEQDSGFDCDSNPDQPYILFDSGSDDEKSDPETFYLDPDPEQAVVMELDLDTEADQDRRLKLEDEFDAKYEAAAIVEQSEDRKLDLCCSVKQEPEAKLDLCCSIKQEPEAGARTEEMESEDFCAVCLNGGDLLCCDRCPKVFHLSCHIPCLITFPLGDWLCTMCRSDQEPAEAYDCENMYTCGTVKVPYTLSNLDQRRCEKLTLLLYCHSLSAPFHDPVSPLARNYYQIIKRPIDLSVIRRKLDKSNTLHYFTAEQFVDDVLLMFKNCATFNYPDSEVAQAGRNLEVFFLSKLKEIFPDRTFPSASQDRTDKARLRWFNRKRKHCFSGKKYYL